MSNTKKYSLPALKQIMKENEIKGRTIMNKPEILKLLHERGLVPDEALVKPEKPSKEIASKYEFTRSIRNNPKKVIIKDIETGTETEYPSIYRVSRTLGCSTKTIAVNNGKIWKKRFKIDVGDN